MLRRCLKKQQNNNLKERKMNNINTNKEDIPFRFKVSGNLIKKLGEESIANKNVAILELIKNAYDAKASKVNVEFQNLNTVNSTIILDDNGQGMTHTDLENKWLNIATPNKLKRQARQGERIPVGEKGIGRLSSESLGAETILITKPKGETVGYQIKFEWNKYQEEDVLCNEVINKGFKFSKKRSENGTKLEIGQLKHDWNDSEVQKSLIKDIYLLHPPNSKPKNFTTKISLPKNDLKKITKNFLNKAAYTIKANLSSGDILKYHAKAANGKEKKGNIKLDKKLTCGNASFELYYYYRTVNAIRDALKWNVTPTSVKETNNMLDEYCGIKIFRDKFRIKPYGETGNDWLSLDLGFQNNTMYPRNNNVFGFVNISKLTNPAIIDTTTREGIVYNNEFQDLVRFVKTSIEKIFLEFRSEIESHKKKAKKRKATKIRIKPSSPSSSPSKDKLIQNLGGAYPQSFYVKLEEEINDCYGGNYSNAAFFLSRKIIENLVFNILEKKFPTKETLWYNSSIRSHHKLSLLISNLYDNRTDFKLSVQRYIEKFNTQVGAFRKEANAKAHNIYEYLSDKSELKKFKINDLVQLLLNVYHNM